MIFSKATLSRQAFGTDHNWNMASDAYRAHELVWTLFSDKDDRKRDFLFRWETDTGLPVLYTVSEREPVDRERLFSKLESKSYDPSLKKGERLAFQLRVNPVVKRRDENGKQLVHDVVMDAKKNGETEEANHAEIVQRECVAWLLDAPGDRTSRAERAGFQSDPDRILVESYERRSFQKRRNGREIVVVTADLHGILEVTDEERFRASLFEGIGPSKAFGCGLLMVRRV